MLRLVALLCLWILNSMFYIVKQMGKQECLKCIHLVFKLFQICLKFHYRSHNLHPLLPRVLLYGTLCVREGVFLPACHKNFATGWLTLDWWTRLPHFLTLPCENPTEEYPHWCQLQKPVVGEPWQKLRQTFCPPKVYKTPKLLSDDAFLALEQDPILTPVCTRFDLS